MVRSVPSHLRSLAAALTVMLSAGAAGAQGAPFDGPVRFDFGLGAGTAQGALGVVPASIRTADGAFNGDEPTWHRANMFWPYFDWYAGKGLQIYDQLLFTDRVYITERDDRGAAVANVMAMLTGALTADSPYFDISWAAAPAGFTALVADAGPDRLVAETFLFGDREADVVARLWRLVPGRYSITVRTADGVVSQRALDVGKRGDHVTVRLPAGVPATISIVPG